MTKEEKARKRSHDWYIINKDRVRERHVLYKMNPIIRAKYREYSKNFYNKSTTRAKINERRKQRRKTDINFAIESSLRARLHKALNAKGAKKAIKTFELLGCTSEQLKQYLESQFQEGMSWNNYGYGSDKWNIDHIKPCDSFDLIQIEQQRECFHYTNLQPLWQPDNLQKSSKIKNGGAEES